MSRRACFILFCWLLCFLLRFNRMLSLSIRHHPSARLFVCAPTQNRLAVKRELQNPWKQRVFLFVSLSVCVRLYGKNNGSKWKQIHNGSHLYIYGIHLNTHTHTQLYIYILYRIYTATNKQTIQSCTQTHKQWQTCRTRYMKVSIQQIRLYFGLSVR